MRSYLQRIGREARNRQLCSVRGIHASAGACAPDDARRRVWHRSRRSARRNVHFDDAGRATLFDFDHSGYGWRVWDVATALRGLSGPSRSALLAGNDAVRPLADAERNALPVFRALRPVWDCGDFLAMRPAWGSESDAPTHELTEQLLRVLQRLRQRLGRE
jgi:Ser/Thr protein kinase RdoA (MazF antagonist)